MNGEIQGLEELLTVLGDIFAEADKDYGCTNKVYHGIDTEDPRPIRQPLKENTPDETSDGKGDARQNAKT
jgi:hypothetical protein